MPNVTLVSGTFYLSRNFAAQSPSFPSNPSEIAEHIANKFACDRGNVWLVVSGDHALSEHAIDIDFVIETKISIANRSPVVESLRDLIRRQCGVERELSIRVQIESA